MSRARKRKHVLRELYEDNYSLPSGDQQIVKVVECKGNNLVLVQSPDNGEYLVSMPQKFRRNIWVRRGQYLLTEPIPEGNRVKAEIVRILTVTHVKEYAKCDAWPSAFKDATENKNAYETTGAESTKKDGNDSESDNEDSDLTANPNRPVVQNNDSESGEDYEDQDDSESGEDYEDQDDDSESSEGYEDQDSEGSEGDDENSVDSRSASGLTDYLETDGDYEEEEEEKEVPSKLHRESDDNASSENDIDNSVPVVPSSGLSDIEVIIPHTSSENEFDNSVIIESCSGLSDIEVVIPHASSENEFNNSVVTVSSSSASDNEVTVAPPNSELCDSKSK